MDATFKNTTGKGNVARMIIAVRDTPHSPAGKAHAQLCVELQDGTTRARDGNY
jgi:hypothetical protein